MASSTGQGNTRKDQDQQHDTTQGQQQQGQHNDAGSPPSLPEKVLMGVSTLFTAALFLFVLWQILLVPAGDVAVAVEDVESTARGDEVTVTLVNHRNVGLVTATVAVSCNEIGGTNGTTETLDIDNVPADGTATGTVVCPAGASPTAGLKTWQTP